MIGVDLRQFEPSGATDEQVPGFVNASGLWVPRNTVHSIVAGTGVTVDDTDPFHPVVSASGGGGSGSLTVQDENGNVATGVTQLDFQGAGVTAAAGTGEVVVTIPGGGGGSATFSGAKVKRSTNSSTLTAGAWTFLPGWDTEVYDTDAYHDTATNNDRFTVPATGYYHLNAHIDLSAAVSSQLAMGFVLNTDSASTCIPGLRGDTGNSFGVQAAGDVHLTAGDYVRLSYYVQSGSVAISAATSGASIHFLG